MAIVELDYMEYATDANAQASYVHNATDIIDAPDTKLLIHFDGADAATTYTAESGQTVTFAGTAQLDTAQKKFGTASLLLDGNSDYVTLPDSSNWDILFGSFNFECWVRFNSVADTQYIVSQEIDAGNRWFLKWESSGNNILVFYCSVGGVAKASYFASWSPNINTWYHIRFRRRLTVIYMYIDGTALSVTEITAISTYEIKLAAELTIGKDVTSSTAYFNGWIDEVRLNLDDDLPADFTPLTYAYTPMQVFSDSSNETQGTYCLKILLTGECTNKTFIKTVSNIDLSNINIIHLSVSGIFWNTWKIGIHDTGGTTTEKVLSNSNDLIWDISSVANANKDAIDQIIITPTNAYSTDEDIYIDNVYGYTPENIQTIIL